MARQPKASPRGKARAQGTPVHPCPSGPAWEERKRRAAVLLRALKKLVPGKPHTVLRYTNPWELLVAVILSAQCTDERVNQVTARLFKKYPTLAAYVHADPRQFAEDIKPTGFYRNKARHILAAAKMLQEEYGGAVPATMEALLRLPGVARKTANVVLYEALGKNEGIAVDTHVRRFAKRFGLSDHKDPEKIERDLMCLLPRREWGPFTMRVIQYGRTYGPARGYDAARDPLVAALKGGNS